MLVEVLSVGKGLRASAALSGSVGRIASELLSRRDASGRLLAAVGRSLLNAVNGSQVPLEYIRSVERLLCGRSRARAEATYHGALVMGQGVSVLVVFAGKALDVILAGLDGALLGTFILMREHVCLEILENFAAVGICASLLLLGVVTTEIGRADW
jgi:hypothetical protein